jgi:hypothetical protein
MNCGLGKAAGWRLEVPLESTYTYIFSWLLFLRSYTLIRVGEMKNIFDYNLQSGHRSTLLPSLWEVALGLEAAF